MAFFGRSGKKNSDVGQFTAQKAEDMTNIAGMNDAISEEENKIHSNYYQIGKVYATIHVADFEDDFSGMLASIRESEAKIQDYRQKIREIKGVIQCEKCGAEVKSGASFCTECGQPIEQSLGFEVEEQTPLTDHAVQERVCSHCGAKAAEDAAFCGFCGTPIQDVSSAINEIDFVKCNRCGAVLDKHMSFCTECGTKLQYEKDYKRAAEKAGETGDGGSRGRKVRGWFLKVVLIVMILAILAAILSGLLVYFDVVEIPVVTEFLNKTDIREDTTFFADQSTNESDIPEEDPEKENIVYEENPEEENIVYEEKETVYLLSKVQSFDAEGNLLEKREMEYGQQGEMIRLTSYDADETMLTYHEYEYDTDENLKAITVYGNDDQILGFFEFDSEGNEIHYKDYGYHQNDIEYEYDSNGNRIQEISNNEIVGLYEYEYDDHGNVIREIYCDSAGEMISGSEYEYDDRGNCIKETICHADSTTSVAIEFHGISMEWTDKDENGRVKYWYEDEYNDEDQPVRQTYYNLDGSMKCYCQYEYDNQGYHTQDQVFDENNHLLSRTEYEYIPMEEESADKNILR